MKRNQVLAVGLTLGVAAAAWSQQTPVMPAEDAALAQQRLAQGGRMSPMEKAALAKAQAGQANTQEGNVFLLQNRKKPGVKVLASGVQYRVLKAGSGKKPSEDSTVQARYVGNLLDGRSFDKVEDAAGTSLVVRGLVPGLRDAVKRMPAGSSWEIVVPPSAAYGAAGGHGIGPNAVLVYQFALLGVK